MKPEASKSRNLKTIASAFPANALLYRWKQRSTARCDHCECPAETPSIFSVTVSSGLQADAVSIAAHCMLAGIVFAAVQGAGRGWVVHHELSVIGLQGLPMQPAVTVMPDWISMWN